MAILSPETKSAAIRRKLGYPIIDSDGHTVEFMPAYLDYVKDVGGKDLADRFADEMGAVGLGRPGWFRATWEQRRDQQMVRAPWWAVPSGNTRDRVTASLPKLLHARLDELGLDFSVLYPTAGLQTPRLQEDELRRVACRALNNFHADVFAEFSDRLTPAACIPMHTPEEAIAELEHAKSLGLKVAMIQGWVLRPVPDIARAYPELAHRVTYLDTFGIDSPFDYDPFWAKCLELRMAIGSHAGAMGFTDRASVTTYMYNHIGHFAAAGEALAKSLFFGGVTRRFPELRIALLEGGVAHGCRLYADLIARWEKRNPRALEANLNPARLDLDLARRLFEQYGDKVAAGRLDRIEEALGAGYPLPDPADRDDFARCGIEKKEDIRDLFIPHFYYGCEADDPMNAWAFNRRINPFGAQVNTILGSDIGHWDVPDMTEVLEEAYEMVEHELVGEDDFRALVCTNAIELYGGANPDFFTGTVVESEANRVLGGTRQ